MAMYYINADTGDDGTGDGSEGNPWETLAHAFDQTIADDTITCQDSMATYALVTDTFNHNITIQGEQDDASGAVFDAGDTQVIYYIHNGAVVSFSKMTFQNVTATSSHGFFLTNATAACSLSLENCKFFNIKIWSSSGDWGAFYMSNDATGGTNLFNMNKCICELAAAIGADSPAIVKSRISNFTVTITNSVLYLTDVRVCNENGHVTVITCINDIFYGIGTCIFGNFDTEVATYCDFYNITDYPAGTGVIAVDPLFVDPDNANFNLRPASPCIDTGVLV